MSFNKQESAAALVFVAIGFCFLLGTLWTLRIGTAGRMGPGYFPLITAGALILTGAGTILSGWKQKDQAFGAISFRSVLFVVASPIVFVATLNGLGVVISLFLTTLCALTANPRVDYRLALLHASLTSAFCTLVFKYALEIPLPLVGTWLTPEGIF